MQSPNAPDQTVSYPLPPLPTDVCIPSAPLVPGTTIFDRVRDDMLIALLEDKWCDIYNPASEQARSLIQTLQTVHPDAYLLLDLIEEAVTAEETGCQDPAFNAGFVAAVEAVRADLAAVFAAVEAIKEQEEEAQMHPGQQARGRACAWQGRDAAGSAADSQQQANEQDDAGSPLQNPLLVPGSQEYLTVRNEALTKAFQEYLTSAEWGGPETVRRMEGLLDAMTIAFPDIQACVDDELEPLIVQSTQAHMDRAYDAGFAVAVQSMRVHQEGWGGGQAA